MFEEALKHDASHETAIKNLDALRKAGKTWHCPFFYPIVGESSIRIIEW